MAELVLRNQEGRQDFLRKRGVRCWASRDKTCLVVPFTTARQEVETVCVLPQFYTEVAGADEIHIRYHEGPHLIAQRNGGIKWWAITQGGKGTLSQALPERVEIAPEREQIDAAETAFEIIDEARAAGYGIDDLRVPPMVPKEWLRPVSMGGEVVAIKAAPVATPREGEVVVVARPNGQPLEVQQKSGVVSYRSTPRFVEIATGPDGLLRISRRCVSLGGHDGRKPVILSEGLTARLGPWKGNLDTLRRSSTLKRFVAAAEAAIAKAAGKAADAVTQGADGYRWATG